MKKSSKRFSYVRKLERQHQLDTAMISSMSRHIDALDALRIYQQTRIDALQRERDELYAHLNGRNKCIR